jgi:hypothetical protein
VRTDTDIHELNLRRAHIPTCLCIDRLHIYKKYLKKIGLGCNRFFSDSCDSDSGSD